MTYWLYITFIKFLVLYSALKVIVTKKKMCVCRFELDAKQGKSQGDEEEEIWAEELLPRTSKSPHTSSPQPSKH